MKLFKHKKGATLDNIWVLIEVFAFAIFVLVIFKVWGEFTSDDLNSKVWDKTPTGSNVRENTEVAINNMDFVFILAYFGLHIGIIVLAFLLRSYPVVYIAGIFVIAILVIVSVPLSNTWEDITGDSNLISSAAKMPKAHFIMLKLPIFETIFAFLTLIAFAAFARAEGYL